MPWNVWELSGWSIVGMNHYHINGERWLFCAMTKNGRCITAEGKIEPLVFDRLAALARAAEQAGEANAVRP